MIDDDDNDVDHDEYMYIYNQWQSKIRIYLMEFFCQFCKALSNKECKDLSWSQFLIRLNSPRNKKLCFPSSPSCASRLRIFRWIVQNVQQVLNFKMLIYSNRMFNENPTQASEKSLREQIYFNTAGQTDGINAADINQISYTYWPAIPGNGDYDDADDGNDGDVANQISYTYWLVSSITELNFVDHLHNLQMVRCLVWWLEVPDKERQARVYWRPTNVNYNLTIFLEGLQKWPSQIRKHNYQRTFKEGNKKS